jgi:hypothetical protein
MTDNMPFDWENMCQQHKEPEIMQKSIEVTAKSPKLNPMKKSMDDSQEKNKQRKPGNKDIAQLEIVVRKEWE